MPLDFDTFPDPLPDTVHVQLENKSHYKWWEEVYLIGIHPSYGAFYQRSGVNDKLALIPFSKVRLDAPPSRR